MAEPQAYADAPLTADQAKTGGYTDAPLPADHPWVKAAINALPGIGGIVGGVVAGGPTEGLAAVPGVALGVGVGRGLRDLIAEGFNLEPKSSPAAKAGRIALDTGEAAAAQAILPGLWEAIKTPGKTIGEIVDMLPAKLRPIIPKFYTDAPATILERPAWQTWGPTLAPKAAADEGPVSLPGFPRDSVTPAPTAQGARDAFAARTTAPAASAAPPVATTPPSVAPAAAAAGKSPQQILNEEAIARARATFAAKQAAAPPASAPAAATEAATPAAAATPIKLTADEVTMGARLVKQGASPADALAKILELRAGMAGSSAFSALPSSDAARAAMRLKNYKS